MRSAATPADRINDVDTLAGAHSLVERLKPATVFYDTTHANKRRQERALSIEQMKEVVSRHEQRVQHRRGEHGGYVYEFIKRIDGKKCTVIAKVKRHECWLITAWREDDEH